MGIAIDKTRISDKPWGDVDKGALGRKLAASFKAGEISRDVIEAVYAVVPNEAFGKDADGNAVFYASKAAYPMSEMMGDALVLNKNGVHAAAQRLASADASSMGADLMKTAKAKLRAAYKTMKQDAPESLKESVTRMEKGAPLSELVKGSLEEMLAEMREAFREQFGIPEGDGFVYCPYHIVDTFTNAVVVCAYQIDPDEYYAVEYARSADGKFVFANRDAWQLVELAWKVGGASGDGAMERASERGGERAGDGEAESGSAGENQNEGASSENHAETAKSAAAPPDTNVAELDERAATRAKRGKGIKFTETLEGGISLVEADTSNQNSDGPWKVRAIGITADVVNRNGRRYRADVLREAVAEAKKHLNESLGQGRLIKLLGEPEHPEDKSTRRPTLLETVVNWTDISFDGKHVLLEGLLLGTQQGKDIHAQMAGGVFPDISQRSRGESRRVVDENGTRIDEVEWCTITGYDLVANGQASDPEAGVTFSEARQPGDANSSGDEEMNIEELLKKLLAEKPEAFKEIFGGMLNAQGAEQTKAMTESVRAQLGLPADAQVNLTEIIATAAGVQKELNEHKRQGAVNAAIADATRDLKYGALNEQFKQELTEACATAADEAAVKTLAESLAKRYDAMMAQAKLAGMGLSGVQVVGPVIEQETGHPEFARIGLQLNESLIQRGWQPRYDFRAPKTVNQEFTAAYLKRFDKVFARQLLNESKLFNEAEQTSDLSLPYSVSRAVVAAVFPRLISAGVFDFGTIDAETTLLFYEEYAAETGLTADSDAPESVIAPHDTWVDLEHQHIIPDTVVVKDVTDVTTYDEDDDYIIDYYNGRVYALSGGAIGDGDTLHVEYDFEAIRKGENQKIERAKGKLSSKQIRAKADRLATQITKEAIVFSRSQIGWDAVTRTLDMLVNEIRRKIDKDLLYLALASVRSVASNSGGTWTVTTDPLSDAVKYFGAAKQKLYDRRYNPTAIILSTTNAEALSNWNGFTAAGKFPDSDLNAEGFIGRLKGQPVFTTTEFNDKYGLVVNRELVAYRVFQPMAIYGPFPSIVDGQLVAADQYYAEEFNAAESPLKDKGSYVKIV